MVKGRGRELLDLLRRRPGLLLGHGSLPRLEAFLNGYIYAAGEESEEIRTLLAGFDSWIHLQYSIESTQGWCDIIQFFERREAEAYKTFFDLLDEYLGVPSPASTEQSEPKKSE